MRKSNFKQAFRDLQNGVRAAAGRNDLSLAQKFDSIMDQIAEFFNTVRVQLLAVPFENDLEEIYFFKFVKPEFTALKIYYAALFNLMNRKPAGHRKTVRKFYLEELDYISATFKRYRLYHEYYRSGATDMDDILFLRGSVVASPVLLELPGLDTEFSTCGEYLFAMFSAYESLQEYILEEMKALEKVSAGANAVSSGTTKKYFEYTGDLINMVELAYGLWVSKQFNNGKASLVEIFRWLEETLGIELGVPSNRFREIKRRKRLSRTHFMDTCRIELLNYMDNENSLEDKQGDAVRSDD
ncbi:MAG: RteC domain-containing protein [Bacteroidota bacterium]